MCAYAGALYVPPAAPAPALPSSPEARRVQANESNSPADESTPEPCEVYQVELYLCEGLVSCLLFTHQHDAGSAHSIMRNSHLACSAQTQIQQKLDRAQ